MDSWAPVIGIAMMIGFLMWMVKCTLNTGEQEKNAKKRRIINSDWIYRDYYHVPSVKNCPRCGSEAHITTSVNIPPIISTSTKLQFNKFDMRIYYSVHCNSCSLGTDNREEMAEVMNDWKMINKDPRC